MSYGAHISDLCPAADRVVVTNFVYLAGDCCNQSGRAVDRVASVNRGGLGA